MLSFLAPLLTSEVTKKPVHDQKRLAAGSDLMEAGPRHSNPKLSERAAYSTNGGLLSVVERLPIASFTGKRRMYCSSKYTQSRNSGCVCHCK